MFSAYKIKGHEMNYVVDSSDEKKKEKSIDLDLAYYILNGAAPAESSNLEELKRLMALRNWVILRPLCQSIVNSPFSALNDYEITSLLFEGGLCAGSVIYHFSKFFKEGGSLISILPMKEESLKPDREECIQFYPFHIEKEEFALQSQPWRFLQATYKIGRKLSLNGKKSPEFIPSNILENLALRFIRRIPEAQEDVKCFSDIKALISQLKECGNQHKAYLLGIGNGLHSHALAVYLNSPFHFVDPSYGVGTARKLQDLLLFLTVYLTENYSDYQSFALLEFESVGG